MHGRATNCAKDHVGITRLVPPTGPEESEIHSTFTRKDRVSRCHVGAPRVHPAATSETNSSCLEREEGSLLHVLFPYGSPLNRFYFLSPSAISPFRVAIKGQGDIE